MWFLPLEDRIFELDFMKRSKQTFLELYEPIHDSFARFCHARAYGVMEPEDLISESVLCALENFHKVKNQEAFLSFMFSIAKNLVNKKYRRQKFMGVFNEKQVLQIPDQKLDAETRMDIEILYQALDSLPANQKDALVLFEISGFSLKEIAAIQHAGESAVKQRLKRGREKLAKILNAEPLKEEPIERRSSLILSVFL
ncbi:MAG: hypothetical protein CL840_20595 [Crocinitomicaceae bacterium]|nr:hypothetical protein [Crocinitomicaceae bacterium]